MKRTSTGFWLQIGREENTMVSTPPDHCVIDFSSELIYAKKAKRLLSISRHFVKART